MTPPVIHVLIADDHAFLAQSLADMIHRERNMSVGRMVNNFAELMKTDSNLPIDVLLLDKKLGHVDILSRIVEVRQKFPLAKLVILTAFPDHQEARQAIKNHCSGYIEKIASGATILESIRKVARGEIVIHLASASEPTEEEELKAIEELTPLEIDILKHMCKGNKIDEIARQLKISKPWVNRNIARLKVKLGVENRTELIAKALDMGLC
jgi:NarL family two-component system response regulator LiaR